MSLFLCPGQQRKIWLCLPTGLCLAVSVGLQGGRGVRWALGEVWPHSRNVFSLPSVPSATFPSRDRLPCPSLKQTATAFLPEDTYQGPILRLSPSQARFHVVGTSQSTIRPPGGSSWKPDRPFAPGMRDPGQAVERARR